MFFVGVLRAAIIFWIRRSVEEPAIWLERRAALATSRPGPRLLFSGPWWRYTLVLTLINAGALFAYSLGLGAPFWVVGTFALSMPKSGRWMNHVKNALGVAAHYARAKLNEMIVKELEQSPAVVAADE